METFNEVVLRKAIKDIIKLDILKKNVGGEALEAIKVYSQGDQPKEAVEVLQNATQNLPL